MRSGNPSHLWQLVSRDMKSMDRAFEIMAGLFGFGTTATEYSAGQIWENKSRESEGASRV